MSLCSLPTGTEAKIAQINAETNVIKRLNELGFTAGTSVKIIRGEDPTGPVLVEIRDTHIMLGNDIALKIILAEAQ
jgi:Fe2+ transport system protein FeoA